MENKNSPVENACFISRVIMLWTYPIVKKGFRGVLSLSEIYNPPEGDKSKLITDKLEKEWNKELEKLKIFEYKSRKKGDMILENLSAKPSLIKAIWRCFFWDNVKIMLLLITEIVILQMLSPIFVGKVTDYFNTESTANQNDALCYATGLVVTVFGISFCMHHYFFFSDQVGYKIRVACTSLIYRKILRMRKSSLSQSTGLVMNLMSNDLSRFDFCIAFLHFIWCSLLQVPLIIWMTWEYAGVAAVAGCIVIILACLPIFFIMGKIGKSLRNKIATFSDKRIQIINELVTGIQIIKMYAWEKSFAKLVMVIRREELKHIKSNLCLHAFMKGKIQIISKCALYISMVTYALRGKVLTASVTYVLASLFNNLELTMAIFLPPASVFLGEIMVSMKRVKEFLLQDELNFDYVTVLQPKHPDLSLECVKIMEEKPVNIKLENVYANWINEQLPPTLQNVSADIKGGELCAVVGLVGSGKSAILNVLLKELTIGAGIVGIRQFPEVEMRHIRSQTAYIVDNPMLRISYASQDAWLFTATVRENILFGQKLDKQRYRRVVEACSLVQDFQQFPYGDKTLVGERGITLSGGQRARINLARAVYKQADLYLLDDPLSAVDAKVGQHIFQRCICEFLSGKTRVLVTHQLQFLARTDKVLLVEKGTIVFEGNYDQLTKCNSKFVSLLKLMDSNEQKDEDIIENKTLQRYSSALRKRYSKQEPTEKEVEYVNKKDSVVDPSGKLNEEMLKEGLMTNDVYIKYFKAGQSEFFCCIILFMFILTQFIFSTNDYWTMYWIQTETLRQKASLNSTISSVSMKNIFLSKLGELGLDKFGLPRTSTFIYIYTFLIVLVVIFSFVRCFLFVVINLKASKKLHNEMFQAVLATTMHFFHNNPSGRILNRFSNDVGSMDELLPKMILETLQIFINFLSILILVSIINHWMIIVSVVLLLTLYFIRLLFARTINSLKRIQGIRKSPVFSHVNATLNGLSTIRSGGRSVEKMMIEQFDTYQDIHTGASHLILATSTAFCMIVDLLCNVFITLITFSFILIKDETTYGGAVGLALSQSLYLTGVLQHGMKRSTEFITQMTSVERILQYTELPPEESIEKSEPLPDYWPSHGRIVFKNVSMKYNKTDPPVLKDLNVTIEPSWKVGIVGRTGAGKTSLISVLFRLSGKELEGLVEIDGRDTAKFGLRDLRSRISIIPQEPMLFTASIRYNLDPFGDYPDTKLWDVLREVELTSLSLDQEVQERGSNLSVGQRQLICLARAILKNNKILVLDEATANIDIHTDTLIQKTVRTKFGECTVLTIAHRLNTVIDSDRIIVMDAGRIVEFGSPYELLTSKSDGHFATMISQLGEKISRDLTELAKQKYHEKTL